MKRYFFFFLFAGFTISLQAQNLAGSKWLLVSIDDLETGIIKDIGASVKATLVFESDSTLSGRFCNNYNGYYRMNTENHGIKLSTPNSTKMLCMGIDKYEKEMFKLFPLANKYRTEGESLFIFTSTKKRLTYKKDKSR